MLLSPSKNGLTSLNKEVRVFKVSDTSMPPKNNLERFFGHPRNYKKSTRGAEQIADICGYRCMLSSDACWS